MPAAQDFRIAPNKICSIIEKYSKFDAVALPIRGL